MQHINIYFGICDKKACSRLSLIQLLSLFYNSEVFECGIGVKSIHVYHNSHCTTVTCIEDGREHSEMPANFTREELISMIV